MLYLYSGHEGEFLYKFLAELGPWKRNIWEVKIEHDGRRKLCTVIAVAHSPNVDSSMVCNYKTERHRLISYWVPTFFFKESHWSYPRKVIFTPSHVQTSGWQTTCGVFPSALVFEVKIILTFIYREFFFYKIVYMTLVTK